MAQICYRSALLAAVVGLAPLSASATSTWATWTVGSPTAATASTPDGRSAVYTGSALSANGAGGVYTASPAIPGEPSGANPAYLGTVTKQPHPTVVNPGDLLMSIDLANFGVDGETTFGLADMFLTAFYRIELLDASQTPLSLTNVQIANYNVTYTNGALIADLNITFNTTTGALRPDKFNHDGGGTYGHSGLALFTNLPLQTRYVRLLSDSISTQVSEGVQIYLGGSAVPEPASALLPLAALLLGAVALHARGAGVANR